MPQIGNNYQRHRPSIRNKLYYGGSNLHERFGNGSIYGFFDVHE